MFCLSNFCCVCLKTNLDYRDITSADLDDITLKQKLNFCAFKQDYLTDEIPLKICAKCYIELRIAYEFRKTCLRNNEYLKEYIFELKHAFSENCSYSELYINLFDDFDAKQSNNDDIIVPEELEPNKNELIVLDDSFSEEETKLESYNNEEYIKLKKEIYNDIFEDCKPEEQIIIVPISDDENPPNDNKNNILIQSDDKLVSICESSSSSTKTINLEKDLAISNESTDTENIPLSKLIKIEEIDSSDEVETVILQNNQSELDVGNNLLETIDETNLENSLLSDISSNCSFFDEKDNADNPEIVEKQSASNTFENCLQNNKETTDKLRCYICNVDFSNKDLLQWHLNIHKDFTSEFIENINQKIEEDKFKCTICKADFSKEILLNWHMKVHEFILSEHVFKCHLCPDRFKVKRQLTVHLRNKHDYVYENKCEVCDKYFASRKNLLAHRKVHKKPDNKWYRCNFCSAGFLEKENLIIHRKKHTENKQFACNICDRRFPYKASLLRHSTSHNVIREKNYHCTYCPKTFEHRNTLSAHIKFHKDTGKVFSCAICKKYFKDKESLDEHSAKHSKTYRYKCEICGKSLAHARSLKLHLLLHKSERKFECSICQKSFKLKLYLTQHMKMHAKNRKQFECKICGCKMNKRNLRRHALLHTTVRPYKCNICGKSYARKDVYDSHIRTVHPNDETVCK